MTGFRPRPECDLTRSYIPALRFNALTRFYDPVVRMTTRERRVKQHLLDSLDIRPGSTVLDLGCGTGTMTVWLKQRYPGASVIGLDADAAILEMARAKSRRATVDVSYLEANATAIPLPDGAVQCVISSLFFHHLETGQKCQVLTEIVRILEPNGELHISDWGRPSNALMRSLFLTVQLLDGFATTRDSVDGRMASLLETSGLRQIRETAQFNTVLGTLRQFRATK